MNQRQTNNTFFLKASRKQLFAGIALLFAFSAGYVSFSTQLSPLLSAQLAPDEQGTLVIPETLSDSCPVLDINPEATARIDALLAALDAAPEPSLAEQAASQPVLTDQLFNVPATADLRNADYQSQLLATLKETYDLPWDLESLEFQPTLFPKTLPTDTRGILTFLQTAPTEDGTEVPVDGGYVSLIIGDGVLKDDTLINHYVADITPQAPTLTPEEAITTLSLTSSAEAKATLAYLNLPNAQPVLSYRVTVTPAATPDTAAEITPDPHVGQTLYLDASTGDIITLRDDRRNFTDSDDLLVCGKKMTFPAYKLNPNTDCKLDVSTDKNLQDACDAQQQSRSGDCDLSFGSGVPRDFYEERFQSLYCARSTDPLVLQTATVEVNPGALMNATTFGILDKGPATLHPGTSTPPYFSTLVCDTNQIFRIDTQRGGIAQINAFSILNAAKPLTTGPKPRMRAHVYPFSTREFEAACGTGVAACTRQSPTDPTLFDLYFLEDAALDSTVVKHELNHVLTLVAQPYLAQFPVYESRVLEEGITHFLTVAPIRFETVTKCDINPGCDMSIAPKIAACQNRWALQSGRLDPCAEAGSGIVREYAPGEKEYLDCKREWQTARDKYPNPLMWDKNANTCDAYNIYSDKLTAAEHSVANCYYLQGWAPKEDCTAMYCRDGKTCYSPQNNLRDDNCYNKDWKIENELCGELKKKVDFELAGHLSATYVNAVEAERNACLLAHELSREQCDQYYACNSDGSKAPGATRTCVDTPIMDAGVYEADFVGRYANSRLAVETPVEDTTDFTYQTFQANPDLRVDSGKVGGALLAYDKYLIRKGKDYGAEMSALVGPGCNRNQNPTPAQLEQCRSTARSVGTTMFTEMLNTAVKQSLADLAEPLAYNDPYYPIIPYFYYRVYENLQRKAEKNARSLEQTLQYSGIQASLAHTDGTIRVLIDEWKRMMEEEMKVRLVIGNSVLPLPARTVSWTGACVHALPISLTSFKPPVALSLDKKIINVTLDLLDPKTVNALSNVQPKALYSYSYTALNGYRENPYQASLVLPFTISGGLDFRITATNVTRARSSGLLSFNTDDSSDRIPYYVAPRSYQCGSSTLGVRSTTATDPYRVTNNPSAAGIKGMLTATYGNDIEFKYDTGEIPDLDTLNKKYDLFKDIFNSSIPESEPLLSFHAKLPAFAESHTIPEIDSVVSVSRDEARNLIYIVGNPGGVLYQTEDGGDTWHRMAALPQSAAASIVRSIPATGNIYAGSTNGALFRLTDDRNSWDPLGSLNISDDSIKDIVGGVSVSSLFVLLERGGIRQSVDGGRTWNDLLISKQPVAPTVLSYPYGYGNMYLGTREGAIYKSVNGGGTWAQTTALEDLESEHPGSIRAIALSPYPENVFIATESGMLFRSLNKGFAWERIASLPNGESVAAMVYDDRYHILTALSATNVYYRSDDSGDSWTTPANNQARIRDLFYPLALLAGQNLDAYERYREQNPNTAPAGNTPTKAGVDNYFPNSDDCPLKWSTYSEEEQWERMMDLNFSTSTVIFDVSDLIDNIANVGFDVLGDYHEVYRHIVSEHCIKPHLRERFKQYYIEHPKQLPDRLKTEYENYHIKYAGAAVAAGPLGLVTAAAAVVITDGDIAIPHLLTQRQFLIDNNYLPLWARLPNEKNRIEMMRNVANAIDGTALTIAAFPYEKRLNYQNFDRRFAMMSDNPQLMKRYLKSHPDDAEAEAHYKLVRANGELLEDIFTENRDLTGEIREKILADKMAGRVTDAKVVEAEVRKLAQKLYDNAARARSDDGFLELLKREQRAMKELEERDEAVVHYDRILEDDPTMIDNEDFRSVSRRAQKELDDSRRKLEKIQTLKMLAATFNSFDADNPILRDHFIKRMEKLLYDELFDYGYTDELPGDVIRLIDAEKQELEEVEKELRKRDIDFTYEDLDRVDREMKDLKAGTITPDYSSPTYTSFTEALKVDAELTKLGGLRKVSEREYKRIAEINDWNRQQETSAGFVYNNRGREDVARNKDIHIIEELARHPFIEECVKIHEATHLAKGGGEANALNNERLLFMSKSESEKAILRADPIAGKWIKDAGYERPIEQYFDLWAKTYQDRHNMTEQEFYSPTGTQDFTQQEIDALP